MTLFHIITRKGKQIDETQQSSKYASTLIYVRAGTSVGKGQIFKNITGTIETGMGKMKSKPYFISYTKINSRWTKDLNIKGKITKPLDITKDNIFMTLRIGKIFLNKMQKI